MLNFVYGSCSKELTLYPHIVLCSLEFTGRRFLTIYRVEFYCTTKKNNIVNNDLGNMKQL